MSTENRNHAAADMSAKALSKLAYHSPTPANIARATVAHANELQRGCVHSRTLGQHWACDDCVNDYLGSIARLLALGRPKREKKEKQGMPEAKVKPLEQGKAWTDQLDAVVRSSWNGPAPTNTLPGMALKLGRSETSIAARLVKLGIVSDREEARTISGKRLRGDK